MASDALVASAKTIKRAVTWTRQRATDEYERRTRRPLFDDARLGWALAVRSHVHRQALRGFANVERARPLAVVEEWPSWVSEGLERLCEAFEVYARIDPGWSLLVRWPTIARDLGVLGPGELDADVLEAIATATARARAEVDVSVSARAKDADARAFFTGVCLRRASVTPADVQLLAIGVGLEPPASKLDPGRRRWAERSARWKVDHDSRERMAALSAADLLLDPPDLAARDWDEMLRGVSARSDSARAPERP